jgi:hypothetical protein
VKSFKQATLPECFDIQRHADDGKRAGGGDRLVEGGVEIDAVAHGDLDVHLELVVGGRGGLGDGTCGKCQEEGQGLAAHGGRVMKNDRESGKLFHVEQLNQ